jgi:hypothetical protein
VRRGVLPSACRVDAVAATHRETPTNAGRRLGRLARRRRRGRVCRDVVLGPSDAGGFEEVSGPPGPDLQL